MRYVVAVFCTGFAAYAAVQLGIAVGRIWVMR